jgi:hypothetical protein
MKLLNNTDTNLPQFHAVHPSKRMLQESGYAVNNQKSSAQPPVPAAAYSACPSCLKDANNNEKLPFFTKW